MKELEELPDFLVDMQAVVNTNRDRLKQDMHSGLAGSEGAGYNDKHGTAAAKLADAHVKLSREIRAWRKSLREGARNMSLEEKLEVTMKFLQDLSLGDRKAFYKKLMELEKNRPDGVGRE